MGAEETALEKRDRLRARLSVEQRTFCEHYAESGEGTASYASAYGKANERAAFRLLDRWYIQDYLEALIECSGDSLIIGRAECLSILAGIARGNPDKGVNPSDQIKAVAQLSKIGGFESPSRHEITGSNGSPIAFVERGLTRTAIDKVRDVILGKREAS